MGDRGRKSKAALSVVKPVGEVIPIEPPKPPSILTKEEASVWREQAQSVLVEYGRFPALAVPIVIEICRHIVKADHVAQLIHQHENNAAHSGMNINDYDRLLKMAERESRGIASHSTKLRALLADRKPAGGNLQIGKPW